MMDLNKFYLRKLEYAIELLKEGDKEELTNYMEAWPVGKKEPTFIAFDFNKSHFKYYSHNHKWYITLTEEKYMPEIFLKEEKLEFKYEETEEDILKEYYGWLRDDELGLLSALSEMVEGEPCRVEGGYTISLRYIEGGVIDTSLKTMGNKKIYINLSDEIVSLMNEAFEEEE